MKFEVVSNQTSSSCNFEDKYFQGFVNTCEVLISKNSLMSVFNSMHPMYHLFIFLIH